MGDLQQSGQGSSLKVVLRHDQRMAGVADAPRRNFMLDPVGNMRYR